MKNKKIIFLFLKKGQYSYEVMNKKLGTEYGQDSS